MWLLLLHPRREGCDETPGHEHGQFKPSLKELAAQDLTCPAALLVSLALSTTQAFSHFQVPHFQSAHNFRKLAYGWVVEH